MWRKLPNDRASWRRLYWIVLIGGLLLIWRGRVSPAGQPDRDTGPAPRPGFAAPSFTLDALDGSSISIADLTGRPLVINFWATWCLPCRTEMPALQRVWLDYQDQGLVILAINLQEDPARVTAFAQELGLSFPILLDTTGQVFQDYQVQLYPTTFFVDQEGVIRDIVYGGPMAETLVASRVTEILHQD